MRRILNTEGLNYFIRSSICRNRLNVVVYAFGVLFFTCSNDLQAQNIGVGTNSPQERLHSVGNVRTDGSLIITPTSSAAANTINIDKATGTLVITQVSGVQSNAVTMTQTPANGQLIYLINSDDDDATFGGNTIAAGTTVHMMYDGAAWKSVELSAAPKALADQDGDTKIQVEESSDEDVLRFDLAGTERWLMTGTRLEPSNSGSSTFIGYEAGKNDDLSTNQNTGIGYQSLKQGVNAFGNTAVGANSGSNGTGSNNCFMGRSAGYGTGSTTGSSNAAFGYLSMSVYTTGSYNSALGYLSLRKVTTGAYNSAHGSNALVENTTGASNSAFGAGALEANTSGQFNVAVGRAALSANTTSNYSTAVGTFAGYQNTGAGAVHLGAQAGYTSTANYNLSIGYQAGYYNGAAASNSAVGYQAMFYATGANNTSVGYQALRSAANATGYDNVAIGYQTMYDNSSGNGNSAFGKAALANNTTAVNNVAIGKSALSGTTTGGYNVALGTLAGYSNTTGIRNVFIGYTAGYSETGSDKLYIDNSATTSPLIYGDFSSNILEINGTLRPGADNTRALGSSFKRWTVVYATNGTIQTSDARFKTQIEDLDYGLEELLQLRSVSYAWKQDSTGQTKLGFIAQELEQVIPEVVTVGNDSLQTRGVNYAELIPVLVKALQEQQTMLDAYQAELTAEEQNSAAQEARLADLEEKMQYLLNATSLKQ